MKNENVVIAVDFDGTLCTHEFPKIGEPDVELIDLLKGFRKYGGKLVLTTLREDCIKYEDGELKSWPMLTEAIKWCHSWGLHFDSINERISYNPLDGSLVGWIGCRRKLDFTYIIDDRALGYSRRQMLVILNMLLIEMKNNSVEKEIENIIGVENV